MGLRLGSQAGWSEAKSWVLDRSHLTPPGKRYYINRNGLPIMSKYGALGDFLKRQHREMVPLTFDEIEKITGTKLPPSASQA